MHLLEYNGYIYVENTHPHTHTCTHTYTHTCKHTHTYTHVHTCPNVLG